MADTGTISSATVCRQYVNSNSSYAAKTKFVARNEIQIHLLEISIRDTSPGPPNFYFHDFYLYGLHVFFFVCLFVSLSRHCLESTSERLGRISK